MSLVTKVHHSTKKNTSTAWNRHSLYVGMQGRVARALGVSCAMVSMVMSGKKTSARISKAIDREIARIEREIQKTGERAA